MTQDTNQQSDQEPIESLDPLKETTNDEPADIEYSGLSWTKTSIFLLGIVVVGVLGQWLIVSNKPEPRKFSPPANILTVEAKATGLTDYPINITTNGTVVAVTRSDLIAQISGEITDISPSFANGGHFTKGETLLEVDDRNYAFAVSNASANYSQALAEQAQEQAESEQARKNWKRSGFSGEPNDLVLRIPQQAAAKAKVASAKATLDKAQLDLERTKIKAPFDGRVITKHVGLGQFVSIGTSLGDIFSDQGLEVLLPLSQQQYAQLDIEQKNLVTLTANFGGLIHTWNAEVVRADSVFDTSTRQINVVAKVLDTKSDKGVELKIGQYVLASIQARIEKQATVVSNEAIREGRFVFILTDGVLHKKPITILWQDNQQTLVKGIAPEDLVVTSALAATANGAKAQLFGANTKQKKSGKPGNKPNENSNSKTVVTPPEKPEKTGA